MINRKGNHIMADLKLGLIGLDTSHVTGFGDCFNRPESKFHIPGIRIEKAYPGGSGKFSMSRSRVEQFTREAESFGAGIVSSLDQLDGLDAFLLESVDGDQHLEQFRILAEFGKPVFIDKPLACCYRDARQILEFANRKQVPVMTASSMRYTAGITGILPDNEHVLAAEGFGPMALLEEYRDYFWYGIHSAEIIYQYLGRGCMEVRAESMDRFDLITGLWSDGRIGQLTGNRVGSSNFGVRLVTDKMHRTGLQNPEIPYIAQLARSVAAFFRTGISPIDPAESLEVIAFLEAASRSRSRGGKTVTISEIEKE